MIKGDKDFLKESIEPFHKFYDGTEAPFGKIGEDNEFHLIYDTTSRYGYMAQPIWGVRYDDMFGYKIFIGECPHKDENGNWVTYNEVPSFVIRVFGGSHYIDEEPDIPHIIDICTDEWRHFSNERDDEREKNLSSELYKANMELLYCSFSTYIKGLWRRMKRNFGEFSYYKGKHSTIYRYALWRKNFHLDFINHWENKSLYFVKSTNEWNTFLFLREDGKWGISRKKYENTGDCCEA